MIKKVIQKILSRKSFQSIFEKILSLSLKVLNIGEGQSVETSGEINVFKILENIFDKKDVIVFDVGAHTGEWFNIFKKNYTENSTTYSFEPSSKSFEELSKIKCSGFFPYKFALGDKSGMLYLTGDESGSSGSQIISSNTSGTTESVKVKTLDEFCTENRVKEIDLLKIDIEGYELNLLRGAKKMLAEKKIKLIQFEFGAPSEQKYSLKEFFEILNEDYLICRILQNGYYPLRKYHHYYEIMSVTNFVAIRRDLINKI